MPGGWNVTFWWGIDEELAGLTHGFNLCHTCSDRMWRICSAFHMSQNCTLQNRTGWIGLNRAELTWVPHGSTWFRMVPRISTERGTSAAPRRIASQWRQWPRLSSSTSGDLGSELSGNCAMSQLRCSMAWFTVRNYVDTITHTHFIVLWCIMRMSCKCIVFHCRRKEEKHQHNLCVLCAWAQLNLKIATWPCYLSGWFWVSLRWS